MSDNFKKCSSCAAINDVIFTNCSYCESPLPKIDIDAISTDDLIMKAGEWVGKSTEELIEIHGPNANEWTGKDIRKFTNGEIVGNAEKYLSILKVRAKNNPTLSITVNELSEKLKANKASLKKSSKKSNIIWISVGVVLFGFILIMAFLETEGGNDEQTKLDNTELQIEEAIKDKNYDYALVLVEKLNWTYEPNKIGNRELVIEYDKKRNGYRTTINQIIERNK